MITAVCVCIYVRKQENATAYMCVPSQSHMSQWTRRQELGEKRHGWSAYAYICIREKDLLVPAK